MKAITVICFLLFVGGYFYLGNYLYAIADKDTPIYSSINDALNQTSEVGLLKAGNEVQIVKCHDVKHYIMPEVITGSGNRGYINGSFTLRRERASYKFTGHKIFACP